MSDDDKPPVHQRWAHLRFSVVGPLLAAPPGPGALHAELERLSQKRWTHPVTGEPVGFAVSTIERWYHQARKAGADPVGALRAKIRADSGRHWAIAEELKPALLSQYKEHPTWSFRLHFDNLQALAGEGKLPAPFPSYSTLRRFLKARGLTKQARRRRLTPGERRAQARLEEREVRSFEVEHVAALWHLDFHEGSRAVLTSAGEWLKPQLLGILDDRSRLACHLQWYLQETAENLVHGLSQAIQKRGLPRSLMTDNGSAMIAHETTQGLQRLGIVHQPTLPYSPYQNAKQESFWGQVEGRLLAMLEGVRDLTLSFLNQATQAWVELEYNRHLHSEIGQTPLERFLQGPDVGRASPSSEELRLAFTARTQRHQRRSDGTVSIAGRRFEVPSHYRTLRRVTVRLQSWDLTHVYLVDERTDALLSRLYPLDKAKNADGLRRTLQGPEPPEFDSAPRDSGVAPLLRRLMVNYAATGLPPAYLAKDEGPSDIADFDPSATKDLDRSED
jgi:transposase InsO family protein